MQPSGSASLASHCESLLGRYRLAVCGRGVFSIFVKNNEAVYVVGEAEWEGLCVLGDASLGCYG